jgi:hypothetical protein
MKTQDVKEREPKSLQDSEIEHMVQVASEKERLEAERLEKLYTQSEVDDKMLRSWWAGWMAYEKLAQEEEREELREMERREQEAASEGWWAI